MLQLYLICNFTISSMCMHTPENLKSQGLSKQTNRKPQLGNETKQAAMRIHK